MFRAKIDMAFLKLLLNLGIIIAVAALPTNYKNLEKNVSTTIDYLLDNIKPVDYKIKLILNIEEGLYYGESNINIAINNATQYIILHSVNLAITETTLINKNVQSRKNIQLVYKPTKYLHEKNIITIDFTNQLIPGNYTLNIEFFGKITNNTKGLFRTSYNNTKGEKVWLIATYLKTIGAQQLFPCWNKPELKAKFNISIKHPTKYTALSNMPLQKVQKVENDMMWTHFDTSPEMSPNYIAIAVINFISISDNNKIKIWHRKNIIDASYIYLFTYYFTIILEDKWSIITLKMSPKVDYVAIPDFPEEALETWGLVFYRETNVINRELPLLGMTHNIMKIISLIARNIAQESVNNILPWLNEGFSRFLERFIIDKNYKFCQMMYLFVVQDQHESFRLNSYFNESLLQNYNLSEINSLPPSLRYHKAPSTLRMLQYLLTNKVFQNGTLTYLNKIASGNQIKPNQFWIAMQDALDEKINNKYNLTERMDGWMKLKNYPILKVAQYYKATYTIISLENFDSIDSNLWIPITYTTQNNFDFNISLHNVIWLKFTSQNLTLHVPNFKEDEWIIVNLQQAGYYRVNYENENWNKIAKYLNSKEYTNIHVLNRAQIIDDAYYFLTTSQIDSSIFWKLMNYLSQERDYIAWYPMIKALEHMSSVLPLSDIRVYNIKKKMQIILNGLLENIGYEESNKDYHINCLKQEAIKWACILDEPNCKKVAASKLKQHLKNPRINILLPWWEEWTYCNGLVMLGDDTWHKIFNIYMKKPDNKYLKFLTCSENIAIIKDYMLMISENHNGRIKDKDCIDSFHFIVAKYAKNSVILDFILSKFETIAPSEVSTVAILIDIINHVYSEEQLYKIRQFVKSYLKPIELDVEHKIKIRISQIKSQLNCLQKLSKFDQIKRD